MGVPCKRPDLAPILLGKGLVTQAQLDEARARGGEGPRLAEVLSNLGIITEDIIHFAVSGETGLPYLHLSPDMADAELVTRFSPGALVKFGIVPLMEDASEMSLAMVDPWDEAAHELLAKVVAKPINISIAARGNVSEVLRSILGRDSAEAEAAAVASEDTTGIALVFQQLLGAAAEGARQIHFDSTAEGLRVRFRVGEGWVSRATLPAAMALPVFTRLRVLAGVDQFARTEYRKSGVRSQLGGKEMELEYAFVPTLEGGSAVLSLSVAPSAGAARTAGEILSSPALAERVLGDLARAGGLVALGIPAGLPEAAGLTDALLAAAATAGRKVVTLRSGADGSRIPGVLSVTQTESGVTVSRVLSLSPEIVHLRNGGLDEQLKLAFEIALAGPAVLVDFGYPRAADVLAHLFHAGERMRAFAAAVTVSAVAVRPARELCSSCRERVPPADPSGPPGPEHAALAHLEAHHAAAMASSGWWRAPGCDACKGTGRSSRFLLPERLAFGGLARSLFRQGLLGEALGACQRDCEDLAWLESGRIGVEEVS